MSKTTNTSKRKAGKYARRKHRTNTISKSVNDRPRLVVTRTNKHIYAQLVAQNGNVLAEADDGDISTGTKTEKAHTVGKNIAEKAKEKDITAVAFDRNGFLYHGRVKALADGAREGGLDF